MVSVLSIRFNRIYTYKGREGERDWDFRELVYVIVGIVKCEICRKGRMKTKFLCYSLEAEFLCLWRLLAFSLKVFFSTDWMRRSIFWKLSGFSKRLLITTGLISHASKVMPQILQTRLKQYMNWELQMYNLVSERQRNQR